MPTNPVTITVTGHAETAIAPNRCVVHLTIEFDGTTRADASEPATAAANALTELIRTLEQDPAAPVQRWALDQIQHSRYRPYHAQGKKLPWNYRSTAAGSVTFRDLGAVSGFVDRAAGIDGVNITRLEWKLSRKAHAKALTRMRDLAVRDALTKAKGYIRSLGYSRVEAVALADPGMLHPGRRPEFGPPLVRTMAASTPVPENSEPTTIPLAPERIRITADVEARFEAV